MEALTRPAWVGEWAEKALDRLDREVQAVLADMEPVPVDASVDDLAQRSALCARLAELFKRQARWWRVVARRGHHRLFWLAAFGAQQDCEADAKFWRKQATYWQQEAHAAGQGVSLGGTA